MSGKSQKAEFDAIYYQGLAEVLSDLYATVAMEFINSGEDKDKKREQLRRLLGGITSNTLKNRLEKKTKIEFLEFKLLLVAVDRTEEMYPELWKRCDCQFVKQEKKHWEGDHKALNQEEFLKKEGLDGGGGQDDSLMESITDKMRDIRFQGFNLVGTIIFPILFSLLSIVMIDADFETVQDRKIHILESYVEALYKMHEAKDQHFNKKIEKLIVIDKSKIGKKISPSQKIFTQYKLVIIGVVLVIFLMITIFVIFRDKRRDQLLSRRIRKIDSAKDNT